MDTMSTPCRPTEPRSGGKFIRARRTSSVGRTPYERPPLLATNLDRQQNPNWLSRLILSPSRMFASGAAKVISSVLGSESASSSSSSDESASDDDIDEVNDDNVTSSQGAVVVGKNPVSEMINDPRSFEWKSETKHAIEQLLRQETFSREECERLTRIIQSRVVDSSNTDAPEDAQIVLRSLAVTEAKKWLEEKKSASNSKSNLDRGTCILNTTMSPPVQSEVGSPVDLAKSYMRARPPWASPSLKQTQLRSPSSAGVLPFKDLTSYSFDANSSSNKRNKDTIGSGSWNILYEIRKVRLKATEDMLMNRPSSQIDWSALTSDLRRTPNSLVSDKNEADKANFAKSADAALNLNGITTYNSTAIQVVGEGLKDEAFPSNLAATAPLQRKGALPIVDGTFEAMTIVPEIDNVTVAKNANNINGTCQTLNLTVEETIKDSGMREINHLQTEVASNGLHGKRDSMQVDEELIVRSSSHDEKTGAVDGEISKEIPYASKTNSGVAGSQDSSSAYHDGSSQDPTWSNSKVNKANKASTAGGKEGRRVSSRYNKGSLGRGKTNA